MFKTLRNRLIFSHILPLILIIPLMGLALIYVLESQVVLPSLARDINVNARLVAQFALDHPEIWGNPFYAQDLLSRVTRGMAARVMLLGPDGTLLASSDSNDLKSLYQILQLPGLKDVQNGQSVAYTNYGRVLGGYVVDVLTPITDSSHHVIGIVRMTETYVTVYEEFAQIRYFIIGILLLGLFFGAFLGLVLALNIQGPIQRVTRAVNNLARGNLGEQLPEYGPDEMRQLARAVNILVDRLRDLEKARRRLLANLVHELGRPLGAIRSANQAILEGASQDKQLTNDLLVGMDNQLAGLERLLEDLSHLHDQVLGALELDLQPVQLREWLKREIHPWQEAAEKKGLVWQEEIPDVLPEVSIDPVRLGQAFGNLASNAIKFTPSGGSVTILAGSTSTEVWIQVLDTGIGISSEDQEKIFTPFYRGSQGQRFPQGMGLGLSIARDLVVAHGGNIDFESAPTSGSRFTIHIPRNSSAI